MRESLDADNCASTIDNVNDRNSMLDNHDSARLQMVQIGVSLGCILR